MREYDLIAAVVRGDARRCDFLARKVCKRTLTQRPSNAVPRGEYRRLKERGVVFTQVPMQAGPVTMAICADTCGNLIQLYQPPAGS